MRHERTEGDRYARSGWFFVRLSDGAVRIGYVSSNDVKPETNIPGVETVTVKMNLETDIPADEWTAIVRHLSGPAAAESIAVKPTPAKPAVHAPAPAKRRPSRPKHR